MPSKIITSVEPVAALTLDNVGIILRSEENSHHISANPSYCFIGMALDVCRNYTREINGEYQAGEVLAGDIIITPPTAQFQSQITGKLQFACVWMTIDYMKTIANSIGMVGVQDILVKSAFKYRDPLVEALFKAIIARISQNDTPSKIYIETMARALCIHLLSTPLVTPITQLNYRRTLSQPRIDQLRRYILENIDRKISTPELAKLACISPFHFCRVLKRTVSQTPQGFIRSCRLEQAKLLVQASNQPLAQIAYACGFTTQSHFTQLFRERYGLSPRRMRDRLITQAQLTIFDLIDEKQTDDSKTQTPDIYRQRVAIFAD